MDGTFCDTGRVDATGGYCRPIGEASPEPVSAQAPSGVPAGGLAGVPVGGPSGGPPEAPSAASPSPAVTMTTTGQPCSASSTYPHTQ